MKVLLIQPPMSLFPVDQPSVVPPMGLAYIASVLKRENVEVKIIDTIAEGLNHSKQKMFKVTSHFGLEWDEIKKRLSKENPDIVGISCPFSSSAKNAHKVAELVKTINKNIFTVMGGAHPSALPQDVLTDPNVDFVVIGEGELTMLELVQSLESSNFSGLKGIAYRNNKKIVINPPRELISNLDELPFPERDLLPMKKYFKALSWHCQVVKHPRFTSIVSSRGCPGRCIFCSIHTVWGHKWRTRSPKNVVDEIELVVEKYGVKEIHFEDDNLTLNKKRMEAICDEIIARNLDIYWTTPNGVAIMTLDKHLLEKMKASGCYRLHFGIEHGDPEFRKKVVRKPISTEHAKNVVRWAKKAGIWTNGFFIIGLPGETEQTYLKTIKFAKELDLDTASFFIATPYPGTDLYKFCIQRGYIPDEICWSSMRVITGIIKTENLDTEDLVKLQNNAYKEFMIYRLRRELNPFSIIKRFHNIEGIDDLKFLYRIVKGVVRNL